MSTPDPGNYPWLPLDDCLAQTGTVPGGEGDPNVALVERSRRATGDYVEDVRRDLWAWEIPEGEADAVRVYRPGPAVINAAVLMVARLHARKGSPNGLAAYGEWATAVLREDADINRGLRIGRYAKPGLA